MVFTIISLPIYLEKLLKTQPKVIILLSILLHILVLISKENVSPVI